MKLSNNQILSLSHAIDCLDGIKQPRIVDGKVEIANVVFKLDAKARWNLARNQGKLQSAIADYNRAKDALINQFSDGAGKMDPANPKYQDFADMLAGLGREEAEINLLSIPLAALALDTNEIPISVLTALQPIITES